MMLRATPRLARRILLVDCGAGVGRRAGLVGVALSSLRHFGHFLLRYRREFQLRHREPQHLLDRCGVPVALIGIAGYLAVLTLATLYRNRDEAPAMLAIGSLAGLGFALYLTYIEGFVLATWCILCLSSLALIFSIAVLSSLLWVHRVHSAD